MEQLDASTLARWAAEPALYETPGKLETANDDWQRGVLRLSASGVVFCDDGRAARGMALDSVVRVTVGERKRFLKKARLTVELQGAAGTCAFDARDAFRRDAFAKACGASGVKVVALADDDTRARVVAHAAGGATAMGLAVALAVPPALAAGCADAEHDGALCRDKSSAGLAFYPNAFATRGVAA
ncbi:hypothetical protein JL720_8923 [Aureococcus anophagefferens]|nr:hypothetical protein JL720_8923 [Aureococcus anophagefferens]